MAKQESHLDGGAMGTIRAATVMKERVTVCMFSMVLPHSNARQKSLHDCDELKPKQREKCIFMDEKKETYQEPSWMVRNETRITDV